MNWLHYLVHQLINPFVLFWIGVGAAALLWKFGHNKNAKRFFYGSMIWLFVISSSPLPVWLLSALENQFQPLHQLPSDHEAYIILVLGAGHVLDDRLPTLAQLTETATVRLAEGIRLHQMNLQGTRLMCSGYSATGKVPQAEVLAKAAVSLGVLPSDTLMQIHPRNTQAEAAEFAARFGAGQPFILVTSAAHMPRAVKHFKKIGLYPVPAPCDFHTKKDSTQWQLWFKPSIHKIQMTQKVMHEWIGRLLV